MLRDALWTLARRIGRWILHKAIEGGKVLLAYCLERSKSRLFIRMHAVSRKLTLALNTNARMDARELTRQYGRLADALLWRNRLLDLVQRTETAALESAAVDLLDDAIPENADFKIGTWESC